MEFDYGNFRRVHHELAWSLSKLRASGNFRIHTRGATPINALPVEVLQLIFQELRTAYPRYPSRGGNDIWDRVSHLACRHVCTLWRSTIDQTSTLWGSVIFDFGDELTKHALEHVQSAPLDIATSDSSELGPSAAKVLKHLQPQHLANMRVMDIVADSWEETEQILALVNAASYAPQLERFHFRPYAVHRDLVITSTIFALGRPRRLLSLALRDITISLPSPLFQPTLVNLDIVCCHAWSSLNEMVETLACLRALETFSWCTIQDSLRMSGLDQPMAAFLRPCRASAQLPVLETITMECPIACMHALLLHIILPSTCSILWFDNNRLAQDDDGDVLSRLRNSLIEMFGSHLQRAHLEAGPRIICDEVHISRLQDSLSVTVYGPGKADSLLLLFKMKTKLYGMSESDVLPLLLQEILSWASVSRSTRFHAYDSAIGRLALWPLVLRSLPNLQHIHLSQSGYLDVSTNLLRLTETLAMYRDLTPTLSSIELSSLDFPPLAQRRLACAISDRYQPGRPKVALCIVNCDVDINRLKDILSCDGNDKIYHKD